MSVSFPVDLENVPYLSVNSKVSVSKNKEQIDVLKARDAYTLDVLSNFDAIPLGMILPTTIRYGSSSDLPDGWIFADGTAYSKTGDMSDLWEAVASQAITRSDYLSDVEGSVGKYVDMENGTFKVPNLDGIFIMGTSNVNELGNYHSDQIKSHSHSVKTFAVNGINVNNSAENFGVGLVDSIPATGNVPTTFSTISDTPLVTETRPKSVSYRYMIKATFTDLLSGDGVYTNADALQGYEPKLVATASAIPVSNANGKIDSAWVDFSNVATSVAAEVTPLVVEQMEDLVVLDSETSLSSFPNYIPKADENGKIDSGWLDFATTAEIDALFS